MIIIICGASHARKTFLANKLIKKYKFPCFSIDHLKMGLIRSGKTDLTVFDDDLLTEYLWPIVCQMIKTAIENKQNLIVEGGYVPFLWRKDFTDEYLEQIHFVCLAMTENYISKHFDDITRHADVIEKRKDDSDCTIDFLKDDNRNVIDGFRSAGEKVYLIDEDNFNEFYNDKSGMILYSHPVFPSFDIEKTAQYYVSVLGFRKVDFLKSVEKHICLYRDDIEIILTQANKPTVPNHILYAYGYDAYFITEKQAELQYEFQKSGAEIVRPLDETDYGNNEFVVRDCDGRYLGFGVKQKKT